MQSLSQLEYVPIRVRDGVVKPVGRSFRSAMNGVGLAALSSAIAMTVLTFLSPDPAFGQEKTPDYQISKPVALTAPVLVYRPVSQGIVPAKVASPAGNLTADADGPGTTDAAGDTGSAAPGSAASAAPSGPAAPDGWDVPEAGANAGPSSIGGPSAP